MNVETITSRQNPLMTHLRKLASSRSYRKKSGEYLCDGTKLLDEALKWGAPVQTAVFSDGVEIPTLPDTVRAVCVSEDLMRSVSPMETPQGALFTVALPETKLPETLAGKHYLVLDGVQDPGNVGTILRTADAFECDGVFLVNACADLFNPKTARATMGAIFRREAYSVTPEEHFALAREAFAKSDYQTARTELGQALKADPRNREMLLLLVQTQLLLGDGDGAQGGAERLRAIGLKGPELARIEAEAALLRGKPDKALELLGNDGAVDAWRIRAAAHLALEDSVAAQAAFLAGNRAGSNFRLACDYTRFLIQSATKPASGH